MTVRYRQQEFPDEYLKPYNATKSGYVNDFLAYTYGYHRCRDRELLTVMWPKREMDKAAR